MIRTRIVQWLLVLVAGCMPAGRLFGETAESSFIPQDYEASRYAHLWEQSPFSSATETIESGTDSVWLLTGISNFDNYPFATITNKQTRKSVALAAGESSGPIKLVHAEWAPDHNNSFAVIEVNGTQKRLQFDENSLQVLAAQAGSAAPKTVVQPAALNANRSPLPPEIQNRNNQNNADKNDRPVPRRRVILRR